MTIARHSALLCLLALLGVARCQIAVGGIAESTLLEDARGILSSLGDVVHMAENRSAHVMGEG